MRLAFERVGSGEPLVLLHGVGHRRQAWYPVLDQLAEQREVVLVDLPGHGQSDPLVTDGLPMPVVLGNVLRQFLVQQELDRPHVAGNSLGGRIALEAGVEGDARSVTALSPAGFWRTARAFAYTRRLFETACGLSGVLAPQAPRLARSRPGRVLSHGWLTAHPMRIEPDCALADFQAFRAARPAMRELLAAATRFTGAIPADVRVTVAWASRDAVLPRNQARVAREVLPHAEHLVLPGCGHVPMSDAPALVAEVILRGSSAVDSPAATIAGFGQADGWKRRTPDPRTSR